MNETILTILNNHEIEDEQVAKSKEKLIATIKYEFANADEILAKAFELAEQNINPLQTENGVISFPVIPLRRDEGLHVRKHTTSQIPYIHLHTFYELIFVNKGKCIQLINDKKVIMDQGDLCILSPQIMHAIMPTTERDVIIKIVIPIDVFNHINKNIHFAEPITMIRNVSTEAEYLLFKILKESFAHDEFIDVTIENYLALLFVELIRSKDIDSIFLEKITQYIFANMEEATLDSLAKSLGYNKSYLSRIINQKTNKSFSELLTEIRMQKASQMIFENICIDNIAQTVGYKTTSGFYKQFNKYYGMTPNEFKQLL
ncbi:MAG: helix-turn-helix domain-containing protein [Christensenellales bacterium]